MITDLWSQKTGKSFLVRRFIRFDEYYFVARFGRVYELTDHIFKPISREVFLDRIQRDIYGDKVVVIDEFYRLSEKFQD